MTASARTDSLRRLLRWVRARRHSGRPPTEAASGRKGREPLQLTAPFAGYASWPLGQACRELVGRLDRLDVDGRARDALVRYFGLVSPPEPVTDIAATLRGRGGQVGLGVRRTQGLVEQAVGALAAALPPPGPPRSTRTPGMARHPSPEQLRQRATEQSWARRLRAAVLLARSHAGTARAGPAEQREGLSLLVALEQLEADTFGGPAPSVHQGRRIEPWLRYRLRTYAWTTVSGLDPALDATPAPSRAGAGDCSETLDAYEDRKLGPRRLAQVDGPFTEELAAALTADPRDRGTVHWLLALCESAFRDGRPEARELLGLARDGLHRHPPPDPELAARALGSHAVLAAVASDPSALHAARLLARARGPLDTATLNVYLTVAAAWSAHGHTAPVLRMLTDRIRTLHQLPPGPDRHFYQGYYVVRLAGTLVEAETLPVAQVDPVRRLICGLLDQPPAFDDDPIRTDLYRVWAELEAARAMHDPSRGERHAADGRALLAEARRRYPPPRRALAHEPTTSVPGHRPHLKWLLAEMRVHLALADREGFVQAQRRTAAAWAREPLIPVLGRTISQTMVRAAERLDTTPEPLVAPDPSTGWSPTFVPPARALPHVRRPA